MAPTRTVILTPEKISQKLERMAYEILENNFGESLLILAGINVRGLFVAEKLSSLIKTKSKVKTKVIELKVDTENPANKEVVLKSEENLDNKVVIIVDDVANTGRTLMYAAKPFLGFLPRKVQVAVLVDRKHKAYP